MLESENLNSDNTVIICQYHLHSVESYTVSLQLAVKLACEVGVIRKFSRMAESRIHIEEELIQAEIHTGQ